MNENHYNTSQLTCVNRRDQQQESSDLQGQLSVISVKLKNLENRQIAK